MMESRAACGCVRWRGVYDARISSRLEMEVLVDSRCRDLIEAFVPHGIIEKHERGEG